MVQEFVLAANEQGLFGLARIGLLAMEAHDHWETVEKTKRELARVRHLVTGLRGELQLAHEMLDRQSRRRFQQVTKKAKTNRPEKRR